LSDEGKKLQGALDAIVPNACVGLFAALGASLRPADTRLPAGSAADDLATCANPTAAVIAFSGASIRGTLVLLAPFDLIAACHPEGGRRHVLSPASSGDWIYVRDWTRELASQLLGRIKTRILPHGVTFDIATPTAVTGPALSGAISAQSVTPARFMSGTDPVTVWFDARISRDSALRLAAVRPDVAPKEGDIVLL
jgi:hypothetical protein